MVILNAAIRGYPTNYTVADDLSLPNWGWNPSPAPPQCSCKQTNEMWEEWEGKTWPTSSRRRYHTLSHCTDTSSSQIHVGTEAFKAEGNTSFLRRPDGSRHDKRPLCRCYFFSRGGVQGRSAPRGKEKGDENELNQPSVFFSVPLSLFFLRYKLLNERSKTWLWAIRNCTLRTSIGVLNGSSFHDSKSNQAPNSAGTRQSTQTALARVNSLLFVFSFVFRTLQFSSRTEVEVDIWRQSVIMYLCCSSET